MFNKSDIKHAIAQLRLIEEHIRQASDKPMPDDVFTAFRAVRFHIAEGLGPEWSMSADMERHLNRYKSYRDKMLTAKTKERMQLYFDAMMGAWQGYQQAQRDQVTACWRPYSGMDKPA